MENEIAFIICKNNPLWYEECVRYIQELYVPEGYNIDIISVVDAESMAKAYNAAMDSSEAKYKVYLHEDLFILHRYFIFDMLKIFEGDSSIGMIGMIGATGCRKDSGDEGEHQYWDVGRMLVYDGTSVVNIEPGKDQDVDSAYIYVEDIDNVVMITQYDYRWHEETGEGRHFCNISQALEVKKHGKKLVVPWQKDPWCYHDCELQDKDRDGLLQGIRTQLIWLSETGSYDAIWELSDSIHDLKDREIREVVNLAEIYVLEKESVRGLSSEWWMYQNWEAIYEYYNQIRFMLIRLEYLQDDEGANEIKKLIDEGRIHNDAVLSIAGHSLVRTENVYQLLLEREMKEPLVSVVLLVYNGAGFVRETIESILNQTYRNIELIIVDDASTDLSREVILSFQDSRIKTIFSSKNRNVVYSGNLGFEAAKGKYIALIGHDDIWRSDKLKRQIIFLEEHPAYGVCFTNMDVIDENCKIVKDSFFYGLFAKMNRTADAWSRKLFKDGNCFCAPSACIRKDTIDKTGYYKYALLQLQDYDLWMRMLLEGNIYIYPEKLVYYRRFNDGKNLSVLNAETHTRLIHEKQYIQSCYIKDLPGEIFFRIFSQDVQKADAHTEKEIACEKIVFLLNHGIYLARYRLAEMLEDAECRQMLEEKYHFDLNSFYRLNAQSERI